MASMLKGDFHLHSSEDPRDVLDYDAFELVDCAAALGYHVLALTLHHEIFCPPALKDYATERGVLMISGVELALEHREILLLGVETADLRHLKTFADLRPLRKEKGDGILILAPHPYFGFSKCAGDKVRDYADCFDGIELCHYYTNNWNRNIPAEKLAGETGKPMVACSDLHQLKYFNRHYCLIDAEPTQASVFAAIRAGRIRNVTQPMTWPQIIRKSLWHFVHHDTLKILRSLGLITPHCGAKSKALA
ncbi:MAG: PHP-associated domain-containing protein [Verrucomicrobiae bacterium]|nr:PHP-associated domain-containing protein [Verrucomicrobiae bacterium]